MTAHLGFWMETTAELRGIEERLLSVWGQSGYREVVPPMLLPRDALEAAAPGALAGRALEVRADGVGPLALRSDFSSSVAWLASRRLAQLPAPVRVSYRGGVLRRPASDAPDDLEAMQVGCERLAPLAAPEPSAGDEEVALLAASTLAALELHGAVLELGHWGLAGHLVESLGWPAEGLAAVEEALNRKSASSMDALGQRYGRGPAWELLGKLLHLGGRHDAVEALQPELDARGVLPAWDALRSLARIISAAAPSLAVRLEPTDIRHFSYYTGVTVKAFTPDHPFAILSGGRYDGVYPALGRPFGACGFAVHLGRLLERRTHMKRRGAL